MRKRSKHFRNANGERVSAKIVRNKVLTEVGVWSLLGLIAVVLAVF